MLCSSWGVSGKPVNSLLRIGTHRDHPHTDRRSNLGDVSADRAGSNQTQDRIAEFANGWLFLRHRLLPPLVFDLKTYCRWKALGEREHESEHVFCDHRTVNAARVSDQDVAVNDLGDHQLMDGGGSRVNPSEMAPMRDLVGAQRPTHHNVGISDIRIYGVVIFASDEGDVRKLGGEFLTDPVGGSPELKAMFEYD